MHSGCRACSPSATPSNRDHMRNVFKDVPVIYGFSSKAPLGPTAASLLDRYFQSGSGSEIGGGRPSAKLLALFAPSSMTVAAGASDSDPNAGFRRDVCQFADDRLSSAERVDFVHQVMRREMAEVRMFLDHLERYSASSARPSGSHTSVSRALRRNHRRRGAHAVSRVCARCRPAPRCIACWSWRASGHSSHLQIQRAELMHDWRARGEFGKFEQWI